MNMYPALQARMGDWKYYIVKMRMREVATEVGFGAEVHEDRQLEDAIQRELNESRTKKDIVTFLSRRPDRFFSSLVVAALGGNPNFYPVRITDDPQFKVFVDQQIDQAFGVLTFDGGQRYYALDGQHRLKAIKSLLDRSDPSQKAPDGFEDEEVSVILVLKRPEDDQPNFLKKYRRLFSSLNRYAKPTSMDTNIIMDEDDAFAILTRRLITEHEFFKVEGKQSQSFRVLTKGKNLRSDSPHFTSLQTLYEMNKRLLAANWRENEGWGPEKEQNIKKFIQFRPDEEYLDGLFNELLLYWDAILGEIPDLRNDPATMRVHSVIPGGAGTDNLLFWPIGQEMLASIVRLLLDKKLSSPRTPSPTDAADAIRGLGSMEWRLHEPPWKHFLLIGDGRPSSPWKMRDEDRKEAVMIGERIVKWLLKIDDLNKDELEELKNVWGKRLIPAQDEKTQESIWEAVRKQRLKT